MTETRYTRSEGFEALVVHVHRLISRSNAKTTYETCEATTTPHTKRARWITPYRGSTCVQVLTCEYDSHGILRRLMVSSPDNAWREHVGENNPAAPSGPPRQWDSHSLAKAIEVKLGHCFRWQRSRVSRASRFESSKELVLAA